MAVALGLLDAVAGTFERATRAVTRGVDDVLWRVAHALGAHRWRDGYEVNLERGWRQYRGSRCAVCDAPWEGW
jgi:hypothetical protein